MRVCVPVPEPSACVCPGAEREREKEPLRGGEAQWEPYLVACPSSPVGARSSSL